MAVIQGNSDTFSAITTAAVPFLTDLALTNLLTGGVRMGSATTASVSDGVNGAWTETGIATAGAARAYMHHFLNNASTADSTVTWSFGALQSPVCSIVEWDDVDSTSTLNATGSTTGSDSSTPSCGDVVTTAGDTLIVGYMRTTVNGTWSQSSNWLIVSATDTPGVRDVFVYQVVHATGTWHPEANFSAASTFTHLGIAGAFTIAAGATPTPARYWRSLRGVGR